MKFCPICGKPLQDNEVCTCQAKQAAPQQPVQPQYQQPVQPQYQRPVQPQYQQPVQPQYQRPVQPQYQQPYTVPQQPQAPRPEGKFVKALKNIPVVFKNYWKNGDKVVETAKSKKDFILPLLFIAIFFLINLIVGICFFARMSGAGYASGLSLLMLVFGWGGGYPFQFGMTLLVALIMTVVSAVLYILFRFLFMIIFAKKPAGQAFFDALIEFGIHSVPVSCIMLLGGLLGLITAWLLVPMIGLAVAYYIVVGIKATLKESEGFQNKFLQTALIAVAIMLVVALMFWMFYLTCGMNYSVAMQSAYSSYGSGSDYSSLLGSLGNLGGSSGSGSDYSSLLDGLSDLSKYF